MIIIECKVYTQYHVSSCVPVGDLVQLNSLCEVEGKGLELVEEPLLLSEVVLNVSR